MWQHQKHRPEVWVEKDAAIGVIEAVCDELDVPYFSCRGYTSSSAMHEAAKRIKAYAMRGQIPVIFHLGDHDPSGVQMSEDIQNRLRRFRVHGLEFRRLALNQDQIEEYAPPPPNPAKETDARYRGYVAVYGEECWELDSLRPEVLADLIREAVLEIRDESQYQHDRAREDRDRELLEQCSEHWPGVVDFLEGL